MALFGSVGVSPSDTPFHFSMRRELRTGEMGRRAMRFERLTDEGPKGREATFAVGETPQPLGAAFVRSANPNRIAAWSERLTR